MKKFGYVVFQNNKSVELYQNMVRFFFPFSWLILSLNRIHSGSARISIYDFVEFLNRLIYIHIS